MTFQSTEVWDQKDVTRLLQALDEQGATLVSVVVLPEGSFASEASYLVMYKHPNVIEVTPSASQ
jgi:ABC-type histidine transport system ATPase subunit